ncbi:MAG: ATP phosphoribosyltransferase [Eggerthellaceae bacterium]|nr:ATP phosphoribosyltransferase [Eggerthellaceae bacterium]
MNLATPQGFRDVLADEAVAREAITRAVADLFASRGYAPIETPTLEAMDVMARGVRVPASPFKLFDATGELLAMRPDVTLQVARMDATRFPDDPGPRRLRYTQRVFRASAGAVQAAARELTQIGVECIGDEGPAADAEVVGLLAEALQVAGVRDCSLALATVGVLRALLEGCGATEGWKAQVLAAYHGSDYVELDCLCGCAGSAVASGQAMQPGEPARVGQPIQAAVAPEGGCDPAFAQAIAQLPRIRGGREAIGQARALVAPLGCDSALDGFEAAYDRLAEDGCPAQLLVDFSVMSSFDYYTGIVFAAYAPGCGEALGSGGRYDGLIGAYGADRPAAGFAFCLEQAMEAAGAAPQPDRPLRIAVPKGSLNADAIANLAACGLDTAGLESPGRQLIIRNPGVEYVIVRPSDAPTFVALGAADCGICGKDSLVETGAEVVEVVDLRFGACTFVVAEPVGAADAVASKAAALGTLRVATKYPRITAAYYARRGQQVDIVTLHGNIELAPLTAMAERIVDITATGTTLRENDLAVVDEVMGSTARFFANPCAFRTDNRVVALARALAAHACTCTYDPIAGASQ